MKVGTKRLIVTLLAIILAFSSVIQMAMADEVQPDESKGKEATETIKDFSTFLNGFRFYNVTLGEDYGENNLVKNGDAVAIRYFFVLPNQQDFVAGEIYELPALPEVFNLDGIVGIEKAISPGSSVYWKVAADRRIEVRFTEDMKGSNISGFMEIICTAELTDATTETIVFDLGQFEATTDSFETENKPGPKPEVAKAGVLKDDGTITWTITATPDTTKENSTLAGYTLTDTFTDREKHTYVEGSLKLDGVPVADGQETNSGFSYVFDEGISAGSHVVTFDTKVNQNAWYTGGKTVVKNVATLQMPDGEETVNAEAEVPIKSLGINKRKDNKIEGLNYKKNVMKREKWRLLKVGLSMKRETFV